jgi:hypothetical protein
MALRELAQVVAELALEEVGGVLVAYGEESEMREIEETTAHGGVRAGVGETGDAVLVDPSGACGEVVSPNWMHAE